MTKIKVGILDDYQNVTHKFADWRSIIEKMDLNDIKEYIGNNNNLSEQLR